MQTKKNQSPSPFQTFLKKFRKQRVALWSLVVVLCIVFAGVFAPVLVPYDPHRPVTDQYKEKGIDASQLTNEQVPVTVWMSDGNKVAIWGQTEVAKAARWCSRVHLRKSFMPSSRSPEDTCCHHLAKTGADLLR